MAGAGGWAEDCKLDGRGVEEPLGKGVDEGGLGADTSRFLGGSGVGSGGGEAGDTATIGAVN